MKSREVIRNRRRATSQSQLQTSGLPDTPRKSGGVRQFPTAGLLMIEAAVYLRYHDERCPAECRCAEKALKFLRCHGVSLRRRGRTYLVRQDAIDLLLDTGKGSLDVLAEQHARLNQRSAARRPR